MDNMENIPDQQLLAEIEKRGLDNFFDKIMMKLTGKDDYEKSYKVMLKIFIACSIFFTVALLTTSIIFSTTIINMKTTYMRETKSILKMYSSMENASIFDTLPKIEQKERLRKLVYSVIKSYTLISEQKLSDDQILDLFNTLWVAYDKRNINVPLILSYMKVKTDFNPLYSKDSREGIAGLMLLDYERFSKSSDQIYSVEYQGKETTLNPNDSLKILILKIDNLKKLFNNREEWVLLALFSNEYDVIKKYWKNGYGEIPVEIYKTGELAEALNYYYAFTNWKIPD